MKIKLTLERAVGSAVDLAIVVEPMTTIGAIAHELRASDPSNQSSPGSTEPPVTLRQQPRGGSARILDPEWTVADAGLASGDSVSLALPGSTSAAASAATGAIVTVVAGPGTGARFEVPVGTISVGRDKSNGIVLDDPLVSKAHARLRVNDSVEVVDLGSANGTNVNGRVVDRALLAAGDLVNLGDTVLSVAPVAHEGAVTEAGVVHFNRSPRLDPIYAGVQLKSPDIPERPKPGRFPVLALIAPLLMGGVLILLMPNNPLSFIFIALSPLLLLGSWVDGVIQAHRQWKEALREFRASLASISDQVGGLHAAERAGRESESPSAALVIEQSARFESLLWTRRPEHPAFLGLRLGRGTLPSRSVLELPEQRKGPVELWDDLITVAARLARIDDVPVVERFAVSGSIGIAGPLEHARAVARATIAQLAGLHSPAEVAIAAIASTQSAAAWDWLKWLPHVGSVHGPLAAPPLGAGGPDSTALIAELEEIIDQRLAEERTTLHLPAVVVLVEDDAPADRARLVALAERGPAASVHLVWVSPAVSRLPAACRTFLDLASDGALTGFVRTGEAVQPVQVERLDFDAALALARSLSPAIDAGAPVDDASDLPRAVSLLSLLGPEIASESEAIVARWRETNSILTGPFASTGRPKSAASLRAVFGQGPTEPFALDLRADGPHALVGGTTGSGKSEFLQSWVLGMATAHSPERVTFLFVDYKGGSAFSECVNLPHSVGLVTDLSPPLVRRALTSLRAELRRREHLFQLKGVTDILDFESKGDPEVPPTLVIVVDEFAALVTDVPEFVDGVVDVAQRGRSLGLHLILATQRPAGVIRDNLRANTNLRIALRVAEDSESIDVLGVPLAAGFDPAIKGRAAARTGPGRIRSFQTGYAGGWTHGEVLSPPGISELRFGSGNVWQPPPDPAAEARHARITQGPKDIKRVVDTVRAAAAATKLALPRKPWLPVLAANYDLSKLPNPRTDADLVFGVLDDPDEQSQPTLSYRPDLDGNLAIIGTGGSGKTTALRAIAVASAITARGGPVHVYAVDFASGALSMLEQLPHVGAVVSGNDEERLGRLFRWMRDVVDDRRRRYPEAKADTVQQYRDRADAPDEPRILLLLDGLGAFREQYESSIFSPWYSIFSQIATDGRGVGVHVVVSADRGASIPPSLASSIQRRIVLRLANKDDYGHLDVPDDVLGSTSPPGRGLLGAREVQIAVLGGDGSAPAQDLELRKLSAAMVTAGVGAAPPVRRLPETVRITDLRGGVAGAIGLADDTLSPLVVEVDGAFVIAGPGGSGRTNALVAIADSLLTTQAIDESYLLSPRRAQASGVGWTAAAAGADAVSDLIPRIQKAILASEKQNRRVGIFVESLTTFDGSSVESDLEELLRIAIRGGHAVVGEAETSTWAESYTLGSLLRASRRGLVLCPESDDEQLLRSNFGRITSAYPPGRGFLVDGPASRKLQVVLVEAGAGS